MEEPGNDAVSCADVRDFHRFGAATHAYCFASGFDDADVKSLASKFHQSSNLQVSVNEYVRWDTMEGGGRGGGSGAC